MTAQTLQTIQQFLSGFVAGAGLGSAYYWYRSATAKVLPAVNEVPEENGFLPQRVIDEGADFFPTLKKQAKFNHLAATYAATAAICQTINSILDVMK